MRWFRHLFDMGSARRHFPPSVLDAIQQAIGASEHRHRGEVVFAVEGSLPLGEAGRLRAPRDRAREVFSQLRVWNTEHNTGVLLYLLLAEHAIEIVGDRGIAAHIAEAEWMPICAAMRDHFQRGEYEQGAVRGVHDVGLLLEKHFPATGDRPNRDELPDRPVLL